MYPEPSVAAAYQSAIRKHFSAEIPVEEIHSVFQTSLSARSSAGDLRTSEQTEHDFWADVIRQLCPTGDGFEACFAELFEHFGNGSNWRTFPDVAPLLSSLQTAGVPVAIASNFDLRLNSVCDGLPDLADVPTRIISSVVGWRKPAPEFFAAVEERLNLPADKILMVGDDLFNDVTGALESGLQACLINRSGSTVDVPAAASVVQELTQIAGLVGVKARGGGDPS